MSTLQGLNNSEEVNLIMLPENGKELLPYKDSKRGRKSEGSYIEQEHKSNQPFSNLILKRGKSMETRRYTHVKKNALPSSSPYDSHYNYSGFGPKWEKKEVFHLTSLFKMLCKK